MQTYETRRSCATKEALDFVDITDEVRDAVATSGVQEGRVTVFSPSEGCSILANEKESGLLKDIRRALQKLERAGRSADELHIGASSVVIPIVDGGLRLGTWQRLLLVELEGPNDRSIHVQIVGE
jgi:secondary thiamine-phosphate synthase enzyme